MTDRGSAAAGPQERRFQISYLRPALGLPYSAPAAQVPAGADKPSKLRAWRGAPKRTRRLDPCRGETPCAAGRRVCYGSSVATSCSMRSAAAFATTPGTRVFSVTRKYSLTVGGGAVGSAVPSVGRSPGFSRL
jgi:hypothetical protein